VIVKTYRDGLIDRKEFVRQWEDVQALCGEIEKCPVPTA
jgi:hypothetical protein